MFNSTFYPTPRDIADKMLGLLPDGFAQIARVLEPSAGKGDLADAFKIRFMVDKRRIHCCEIHPDLQAALRGKGYTVVGGDFLTFQPMSDIA